MILTMPAYISLARKNISKAFDDSSWDAITALSVDPIGK